MALYNHKVPVIIKKNFTFCFGKSRENFPNIFQDFETKFKDFPGQQKNPGLFQDVATLFNPKTQDFKRVLDLNSKQKKD